MSAKPEVGKDPTRHDATYVLRICAVAALGGFLFGYDTSVISGAIGPLREYFHLNAIETGWAVSNVIVGCAIGALAASWLAHRLGRRMTLFICAVLFSIQSIGAPLTTHFFWFVIYRLIGGVAIGVASTVSPMYMSEVAPKDMRGRAISMQHFALVIGQCIVLLVNYLIAHNASNEWLRDSGWRWMIASALIPCVIFCATIFLIPESPRWHILRGREDEALKTLTRISNEEHAISLMAEIRASSNREEPDAAFSFKKLLADRNAIWIIFVGSMIAGLQQVTGVNVVLYYAPMILTSAGGTLKSALGQMVWIGVAQLIGWIIGAWLIDKKGRKPLMRFGSIGMAISLFVIAWGLYTQNTGFLTLFGMLGFMGMFALSWGLVCWVLVSEVFPNRLRSVGMSLAVAVQWTMNFIVSQLFPVINENAYLSQKFHGAFSMWLFGFFCLLALWFVSRCVPETKGISLEKIEDTMMSVAPLNKDAHKTKNNF
ncbi:sugar porter family MFS transporter [Gluconobacter cerinus]|uniref:sugar porter family MFS transporter n=1 Tax=Gluconobacter cerinus TaxID=38307 RepID=UPI001B8D37EE|nr:sugar porter family MFS transporter [Gluconobacter cerinus]MBS1070068.1 sugar porter family MFS transporter [Gluconobacter cerinus]